MATLQPKNVSEMTGAYVMLTNTFGMSLRTPTFYVTLLTILLAIAYMMLWNKYRPYNVDDPWSMSFAYNLCHNHSELDETYGTRFPNGMGGTIVFGKLAAYPQCIFFDLFGWTKTSLQAFAKLASLAGLLLITLALIKAGFEQSLVIFFAIAFIAMEPFFNMANQSRPESVTFLFLGAALLLIAYGRIVLAGLISAAAVEIQPIGIAVPLIAAMFVLSFLGESWRENIKSWRNNLLHGWIRLALGGVLFVPFYFVLHPHIREAIANADTSGAMEQLNPLGFLYYYFFEEKFHRHIPELLIFIFALVIYIRNIGSINNIFPLLALILMTALSFAIGHGNFNYTVFWYFPALLLLFQVAQSYRLAGWFCVACLLYVLPQYALAYVINRNNGLSQTDITKITQQIQRVAAADQRPINIFGDYTLWFAAPSHYTVARQGTAGKASRATMVLCMDKALSDPKHFLACDQIGDLVPLIPATTVELPSARVKIFTVGENQRQN